MHLPSCGIVANLWVAGEFKLCSHQRLSDVSAPGQDAPLLRSSERKCLIFVSPPAQRMGRSMQVPCDTEFPAFISERTIKENTGHVDCDGCIKYETPAQIPTHASGLRVQSTIYCNWLLGRNCENQVTLLNFILEKYFLSAHPCLPNEEEHA